MTETETTAKNHDEYIKTLISQLGSPVEAVRKKAMGDLTSIDDPKAIKILTGFISHKDNLVRYSVRRALNEIEKRRGDKLGGIGNGYAAIISAPGDSSELQTRTSSKIFIMATLLILLHVGLAAYFFFRRAPENALADTASNVFHSSTKTAAPDRSKYNVINFDNNGGAAIKIKGIVIYINKIKREAIVTMNYSTAKCVMSFKDGITMDFEAGNIVEAEGELIRNDNIGPVLIQCNKINVIINKNR